MRELWKHSFKKEWRLLLGIFAVIIVLSFMSYRSLTAGSFTYHPDLPEDMEVHNVAEIDNKNILHTPTPTEHVIQNAVQGANTTSDSFTIQCTLHTGRVIMSDRATCNDFNARKFDPYEKSNTGGSINSTIPTTSNPPSQSQSTYPPCTIRYEYSDGSYEEETYTFFSPEECEAKRATVASIKSRYNTQESTEEPKKEDEYSQALEDYNNSLGNSPSNQCYFLSGSAQQACFEIQSR